MISNFTINAHSVAIFQTDLTEVTAFREKDRVVTRMMENKALSEANEVTDRLEHLKNTHNLKDLTRDAWQLCREEHKTTDKEDFYASFWLFHYASITEFLEISDTTSHCMLKYLVGFWTKPVQNTIFDWFGPSRDFKAKMNYLSDIFPTAIKNVSMEETIIDDVKENIDLVLQETTSSDSTTRGNILYILDKNGQIAEGTVGATIQRCTRFPDGQKFAAKRIDPDVYYKPKEELKILSTCKHENVVTFLGSFNKEKRLYFVMELCAGDVEKWVSAKAGACPKPLDEGTGELMNIEFLEYLKTSAQEILRQSVKGIQYLHKRKIVHRDIKPANFLLIRNGDQVCVRVSDFGLSRQIKHGNSKHFTRPAGSESYMAPECYSETEDTPVEIKLHGDIFSLGVCFYYIITYGKYPFGEDYEHKANIRNKRPPNFEDLLNGTGNSDLSAEQRVTAYTLIKDMIDFQAEKRPTIETVSKHPTTWDWESKAVYYWDVAETCRSDKKELPNCFETLGKEYHGDKYEFDPQQYKWPKNFGLDRERCKNIFDVIRVIRNMYIHRKYKVRKLGNFPDCFLDEIPHLLVVCYDYFRSNKDFSRYYQESEEDVKPSQDGDDTVFGDMFENC